MFGKIYISILVSFSLFSCFMAIAKSSIFDLHLKNFRRSLYTLFLLSLGVGVITESINIEDWTYILSLTAIVVFIDLSVLLTPSILKIWQAEFLTGSEFLEATIKENEKIQTDNRNLFNRLYDCQHTTECYGSTDTCATVRRNI